MSDRIERHQVAPDDGPAGDGQERMHKEGRE